MKNKIIIFTFLFFYCSFSIKAQKDTIMPLHGNSVLMKYKQTNKKDSQRATSVLASIFLPFYDDFSYFTSYPDPAKWDSSQSVFVNHSYPIAPPTIGVATFDGLNRYGYPYNIGATSGSVLSDSLISMPIRLDSTSQHLVINPGDTTVYLSFYYQAKGRGDSPEYNDDLELFFRDSTNQAWTSVWSVNNPAFPLPTDTGFHRVMIPIYRTNTDSSHFTSQFQFMFRNRGSQCGAIDHWHLDLIYLNRGRSYIDTVIKDLSFVYDEKSLLKNYMQMPYNQFSGASDMGDSVHAVLRSNDTQLQIGFVTTGYEILDHTGAVIQQNFVGGNNVNPFWSGGYCNVHNLVNAPLNGFTYNGGVFPAPTSFLYKFYTDDHNDAGKNNDTAYFNQTFSNFYSYDDGTAEAGYGLNLPTGYANGEIVLKFKLNYADTLRALDIFFDPITGVNFLENSNIRLLVFADNAGMPGNTIFMDSLSYPFPLYGDNGYDYFQRYQLSKAIPLAGGTTFYVGVYQLLNLPLGIGFDRNNDTRTNIFYNYTDQGGNWAGWASPSTSNPDLNGSLMIHPVFGDSLGTLGVKSFGAQKETVSVYPNPASDEIFIQSDNTLAKISITDLLGNTLLQVQGITDNKNQKINVATLPNGLYLLTTVNNTGQSSTQKLIISH